MVMVDVVVVVFGNPVPSWGSTTVRRYSIYVERWYEREQGGMPERIRYNFLVGFAGRRNGVVGGWVGRRSEFLWEWSSSLGAVADGRRQLAGSR